MELISGDKVALSEKSTMSIEGIETLKAEAGKVIFNIKKRGQTSGLKVALTSSVIGVKGGTKFLVDTDENQKHHVYLKEGKIECTTNEGKFKVYKEVIMDEYEAYVKKNGRRT